MVFFEDGIAARLGARTIDDETRCELRLIRDGLERALTVPDDESGGLAGTPAARLQLLRLLGGRLDEDYIVSSRAYLAEARRFGLSPAGIRRQRIAVINGLIAGLARRNRFSGRLLARQIKALAKAFAIDGEVLRVLEREDAARARRRRGEILEGLAVASLQPGLEAGRDPAEAPAWTAATEEIAASAAAALASPAPPRRAGSPFAHGHDIGRAARWNGTMAGPVNLLALQAIETGPEARHAEDHPVSERAGAAGAILDAVERGRGATEEIGALIREVRQAGAQLAAAGTRLPPAAGAAARLLGRATAETLKAAEEIARRRSILENELLRMLAGIDRRRPVPPSA
jgi:hypothetical protein